LTWTDIVAVPITLEDLSRVIHNDGQPTNVEDRPESANASLSLDFEGVRESKKKSKGNTKKKVVKRKKARKKASSWDDHPMEEDDDVDID
jgi:hypothetical protein